MTTRQTQAIMRKSLITAGLAAASLAAIVGLTGCGGSAARTGQAPPNPPAATATSAAQVLQADGYTVDPATLITPSQALTNLGIVNRASGTRGGDAERVLIFSGHPSMSVPACKTTPVCTPAGLAGEVASQDPGTQAHAAGLVVRITGTAAAFQKDGLPV